MRTFEPQVSTLLTALLLATCVSAGCSEDEATVPLDSETAIERVASAQTGETIALPDITIEGTLTIPPGVNVTGIQGKEVLIQPEAGTPGIIIEGAGNTELRHIRISGATGVGLSARGRSIVLENIEVTGTKRTDTNAGHGIEVRDAPSFVAVSVSSRDNDGAGLHIEGTSNIAIIDPKFVKVPGDLMEEASRVVIHPSYMPIDDEDAVSVIHPSYTPTDDDGISVIHPSYVPKANDGTYADGAEFIVVIDPEQFSGAQFSGNDGDGISVIHPSYIIDPEGPDLDSSITDVKPAFLQNTEGKNLVIAGIAAANNKGAGVRLQGEGTTSLQYLTTMGNQTGVVIGEGTVSMNAAYVANNDGPGIQILNGTLQNTASSGRSAWSGQAPEGVSVIHPSYLPQDGISVIHPSYVPTDEDGISVIHPSYIPICTVENNGGGGIEVAPIDPPELGAGKADGHTSDVVLDGLWIRGNTGFGVRAECRNIQVRNTLIAQTRRVEGAAALADETGTGALLAGGTACPDAPPTLDVDKGSLIAGNAGSGIRARNGAIVEMTGAVMLNQGVGIHATGGGTTVNMTTGTASDNCVSRPGADCPVALVAYNTGAGIAAGPNTAVNLIGARLQGTFAITPENPGIADLGDGLWANGAAVSSSSAEFVDNQRAGIVLRAGADTPTPEISASSISGSIYGITRLKPASITIPEALFGLTDDIPNYWNSMESGLSFTNVAYEIEAYGCFPVLGSDSECFGPLDACNLFKPCGGCSTSCTLDAPCIAQQCDVPDTDFTGLDLAGGDFSNKDLAGSDFSNAALSGSQFSGADLTNANFAGADLTNVDLSNATLTGANFQGATLTGANVSGADLSTATLTGVILPILDDELCPTALPDAWWCQDGYLWGLAAVYDMHDFGGKTFNFAETDMRLPLASVSLAGAKNLIINVVDGPGIDAFLFDAASAENITINAQNCTQEFDFQQADFQYSKQITIDIQFSDTSTNDGTDFRQAIFVQAADMVLKTGSGNSDWSDANLSNAHFTDFKIGLPLSAGIANMTNTSFIQAQLGDFRLNGAQLENTSFNNADLRCFEGINCAEAFGPGTTFGTADDPVTFDGANLQQIILANRDLTHATLQGSDLTNAGLNGSDLTGVDLTGSTLINADMSDTILTNANLTNADITDTIWFNTICPTGVNSNANAGTCCFETNGASVIAGCGDSYVNGQYAGIDFSNQDLTGANFSGANLTTANFQGATLTGANFTGANLIGANLAGVDLSTATLTGVVHPALANGACPAALPTNWWCQDGFLWGKQVKYMNYDFSGKVFTFSEPTGTLFLGNASLNTAKNLAINVISAKQLFAVGLNATSAENISITATGCTSPPNFTSAKFVSSKNVTLDLALAQVAITDAPATFDTADFSDATALTLRTQSGNYSFNGTTFDSAAFTELQLGTAAPNMNGIHNLVDVSFQGVTFGDSYYIRNAALTNVTFNGASMGCGDVAIQTTCAGIFDGTTFGTAAGGVTFDEAQLYNVSLANTDLTKATFTGTNLTGVDFSAADLTGINLSNATLANANLGGAAVDGVIWSNTTCPAGINSDAIGGTCCGWATGNHIPSSGCINYIDNPPVGVALDGSDLVGAYFVDVTLPGADFDNADLKGAHFSGADLSGASFKNADLTYANFENANLSAVNFNGATLTNANFTGAELSGAYMDGVDLSTATLTGVIRPLLNECPAALPVDWMCGSGPPEESAGISYLWGPEVDYSGYNFTSDGNITILFDASQGDNLNLNGANLSNTKGLTLVTNAIGLTATSLTAVGAENLTLRTLLSGAGAGSCVTDTAQNGICDGTVTDLDGDGWFNEVETLCGTDPMSAASNPPSDGLDIDNDMLCDAVDLDDDGDGWSDQAEIFCQTSPSDPSSLPTDLNNDGFCDIHALDADGDDWPDAYETACGTDINNSANNPTADGQDIDSDQLCDLLDADDDGDGWPDDFEINCGFDPLDPNSAPLDSESNSCDLLPYPDEDPDGDGFTNEVEAMCGSNPLLAEDIPVDTDDNLICDALDPVGNPAVVIDYTGADFSGSTAVSLDHDVTSVGAPGVTLTGANFTGAQALSIMTRNPTLGNWENAIFDNAVITELSTGIASDATTLGSTPGSAVVLTGTSFDSAVLQSASFMCSDLTGVDFTGASLTDINWKAAICPSGVESEQNGRTCCGELNEVSVASGCGADYAGQTLSPSDLAGDDLSFANFFNATFNTGDFTGKDLTGATFVGVDLSGASFIGATLIGADFFTATLYNADFTGIDLTGATFEGADLTGADFSGADLTNTNFTGADLSGVNFSGANLTNTNFTDADLSCVGDVSGQLCGTGANFSGANLTGANLTAANLKDVSSGGITGIPAALPADWTLVNGYLIGPWASLANANLSGADLQDVNLHAADLTGAHLIGANLTGADLAFAYLMESDCTNADLTNATLVGAMLKDADLTNALLINISANTVNFGNTNLSGADLTGADLFGAEFFGADLTGTDLSGATLTNVMSANNIGTPLALPTDYFMASGYIIGPAVSLEGANLSGVDLSGANLQYAYFFSVNLTSADLSNTNLDNAAFISAVGSETALTGVISGGITGTPAVLPAGWLLVDGYLVGPGANLANANFSGADLSGAILNGADLSLSSLMSVNLNDADLTDADLTGVTSGNITGTPTALPTDWILINGYLVGPGADLSGVNLSGEDLSGENLTGADLTGADLTGTALTVATLSNSNLNGADLTGADLTGADLTGADLTGVILSGVTSGDIIGTPFSLPTGWTLTNGYLVGPGANFSEVDLNGMDLSGVDFSGANLSNASLNNTNLTGSTLTGVDLTGTDLSTATLTGIVHPALSGCPSNLPTGWTCKTDTDGNGAYLFGPSVNYAGYDFGNDTTESILSFLHVWPIDLSPLNLSGANFDGAKDLTIQFANSGLDASSLSAIGADNLKFESGPYTSGPESDYNYTGANFSNSQSVTIQHYTDEGPSETVLENANFSGAQNLIIRTRSDGQGNWKNTTFDNAIIQELSIVWIDVAGLGIPSGAAALLTGASFKSVSLDEVSFSFVDLTGADFTGASLASVTWADAICPDGTEANSIGATCCGALDTGSNSGGITASCSALYAGLDLEGVNFEGLDLSGADFSNANLAFSSFLNATLTGATFAGATLGYADFQGADASNATLTGVVSPNLANCPSAVPTGWWCDAADTENYLWGEGVNYNGHDFENRVFVMNQADMVFPLQSVKLNGSSNVTLKAQGCQGFNANLFHAINSNNLTIISKNSSTVLDFSSAQFTGAENLTLDLSVATAGKAANVDLTSADFTNTTDLTLETHGGQGDWSFADFTDASIRKLAIGETYTDENATTLIDNVSFENAEFSVNPGASEYLGNYSFKGAVLANVSFANATMDCEVITQGSQNSGQFGPNTTLSNVNFSGASVTTAVFKGLDLTGANFSGADLTDAILKEANLTGLEFSGTTLLSIVWNQATCPDGQTAIQNSCCNQLLDPTIVSACSKNGQ